MKIVDRQTFLTYPDGTVFAKYQPHVLDPIAIKGETMGNDFVVQHTTPWFEGADDDGDYGAIMHAMQLGADSPPLDYDFAGRDGLFDRDQLFAVFSAADVDALIARLAQARSEGYAP